MTDFEPGSVGFAVIHLVGGPLDGLAYNDIPIMADGEPPTGIAVPVEEDERGVIVLYARYTRRETAWPDGRWYHDFVEVSADPTPPVSRQTPVGTSVGSVNEHVPIMSEGPLHPAPRFVLAQAWWVAAELCRRSSQLRTIDAWPMNGFYHGLEVGRRTNEDHVFMNFLGHIHLNRQSGQSLEGYSWAQVVAAESPHEVVRGIEDRMGWTKPHADATTPRSLIYRLFAAVLTAKLNDRERWLVESLWSHSRGDREAFPPRAAEAIRALPASPDGLPPDHRTWVLSRGTQLIALISDTGMLFRETAAAVELMDVYRQRRNLEDVMAVALA